MTWRSRRIADLRQRNTENTSSVGDILDGNVIIDPGFELNTTWSYTGTASRVTELPRNGAWSAKLTSVKGLVLATPTDTNSVVTQAVTMQPGRDYTFSLWYYAGGATAHADLVLELDPGDGTYQEVGRVEYGDGAQWLKITGSAVTATDVSGNVRASSESIAGGSDSDSPARSSIWYVDDVTVTADTRAGDLVAFTANTTAPLTGGLDGQVLRPLSSENTGLEWASIATPYQPVSDTTIPQYHQIINMEEYVVDADITLTIEADAAIYLES